MNSTFNKFESRYII